MFPTIREQKVQSHGRQTEAASDLDHRETKAVDLGNSWESVQVDREGRCSQSPGNRQLRVFVDRWRQPAISTIGKQEQQTPATVRDHCRETEVGGVPNHQETDSSVSSQTDRGGQGSCLSGNRSSRLRRQLGVIADRQRWPGIWTVRKQKQQTVFYIERLLQVENLDGFTCLLRFDCCRDRVSIF